MDAADRGRSTGGQEAPDTAPDTEERSTPGRGPADSPRRLFFALDPDELQRHVIAAALRPALASVGGRRIAVARLHLTLVFLGLTAPSAMPCLRQAAAGVRGIPFELTLDRIGYWRRSEVLWLAPRPSAALYGLHAALRAALVRCGVALEDRTYQPHVTLVRKLDRMPDPFPEVPPIPWKVRDFVLMESNAGYRVLERWELRLGASEPPLSFPDA